MMSHWGNRMATKKIKVLKPIPGYEVGAIVEIKVNRGVPLKKFWRDRLKDAAIDNCVEIVKSTSTSTKRTEGDK